MKRRLEQAGFWSREEKEQEINISLAWSVLSRLGLPGRYGGKSQDGLFEYLITDPHTGEFIASGKGDTLENAMCAAAINACGLTDSQRHN